MTYKELFNLIGILILICGAFFGERGFFKEKDNDLAARTKLYFGNNEHFMSMLFQKYNEILAFCLIIVGSVVQLLSSIIDLNENLQFKKNKTFSLVLIIVVGSMIVIKFLIDRLILWKSDKVPTNGWIYHYKHYLEKEKSEEYNKALKEIRNILRKRTNKPIDLDGNELISYAKRKFKIKSDASK